MARKKEFVKLLKIIALLFSVIALGAGLISANAANDQPPAVTDQELIEVLGCKGCHSIAGEGGSLAPELTQIGSRMTEKQIAEHLTAAVSSRNRFMPSYHSLQKNHISRISTYLYNLK